MQLDPEFWTETLNQIITDIVAFLPTLVGALLWVILGWVVARVVQFGLARLLRRVGLDGLAKRAGADKALGDAGLDPSVSHLIARLIYWLVLLVFVLAAAENLGLTGVVDTLEGLVGYIPSVLAAALILLLGGLLARVVGDGLGGLATQAGVSSGPLLGRAVRYILLVFVVILSLEQLGIQATLLTSVALALVVAVALTLSVAFGIGSRELARNIMASFHAKEVFTVGQTVRVRGHTGRLVEIGPVKSLIETDAGTVSLPNSALTEEEVTVLDEERGS